MKEDDVYDDDVSTQIFLYSPSKYPETYHDISGNSFKELFVKRESTRSLQSKAELEIPPVNSVLKGKNSFGSIIRNSLPIEIREDHSISPFVTKIKQWKAIACPRTICTRTVI